MKFKELKNRFKNKFVIRIAAGVLTIAVLGTGAGFYSVHAANAERQKGEAAEETSGDVKETASEETSGDAKETASEEISGDAEETAAEEALSQALSGQTGTEHSQAGKEETVYVVADASGKPKSVIVSEWLKNPEGKDTLVDDTDLSEIENVKGDEEYTKNSDGTITWQAGGQDIYYQGTTKKELPVELKVTYTLDGKEISLKELAGKSGKVTIRMDYTNKARTTVLVNGAAEEAYVPFTAVSGMILPEGFTNVSVTNGKVISDGKNQMVVGVAMPGLKESLKLEEGELELETEIPEYVEVSADVEDFSLDMTMTMLMSDVLSDLQMDDGLDLTDLSDAMDTLEDAALKLTDGSGELKDGLGTLKDSLGEYASGVETLKDGVDSYTDGAAQIGDGILALESGAGALAEGAGTLSAGVSKISDSFTAENGLRNGASALKNGVERLDAALHTAMTGQEQQAVAEQAKASVAQNFAEGTHDAVAAQAASQFEATMQNSSSAIGQQLCGSELYTTMTEALYQQKIFEAYQANQAAVDAAIEQYAQAGQTVGIGDVVEATYQQQTGHSIRSEVEAGVAATLKESVAPQIAQGIASMGKNAMGESVAKACEAAAQQAAAAAAVSGAEGAKAQIAAQIEEGGLVSGAGALSAGVEQLYQEGIQPLKEGVDSLTAKLPDLTSGIGTLAQGSRTLTQNNSTLKDGARKLFDATGELSDGVNQLKEGSEELSDGMEEFEQEGIQKLADTYHGDVETLLNRMEAVMDAGKAYQTFTKKAADVTGNVKFIIRTEGITAEE